MLPQQTDWALTIQQASRDPYKVAQRILPLVLLHFLWSALLVCLRCFAAGGPLSVPTLVSPVVHTLLGGVLGLLLAFRTNQAFERYWSACSAWAQLHRVSHNVARVGASVAYLDPRMYTSLLRHLIVSRCNRHNH